MTVLGWVGWVGWVGALVSVAAGVVWLALVLRELLEVRSTTDLEQMRAGQYLVVAFQASWRHDAALRAEVERAAPAVARRARRLLAAGVAVLVGYLTSFVLITLAQAL